MEPEGITVGVRKNEGGGMSLGVFVGVDKRTMVGVTDGTNGGDAGNNLTLTFGIEPFLGDGECDESLVLDEDFGLELNFNCAEWDYDGGDCESPSGRIIYGHKFANSILNYLSSPIP